MRQTEKYEYNKIVGKLISVDFDGLFEFAKNSRAEVNSALFGEKKDLPDAFLRLSSRMLSYSTWDKGSSPFPDFEKEIKRFKKSFDRYRELNREVDILYKDEKVLIFQMGIWVDYLPTSFCEVRSVIDYDLVSISDAKKLLGISSEIISDSSIEVADQSATKKDLEGKINDTYVEIKKQEEEMEEKKREIEEACRKQIEVMKAEMQVKLQELQIRKKELERDVFKLDAELYSLRSLLGDNVEVVKLREGKRAPKDQPIVLYQKLRYLDEDLAKMSSLYQYAWENSESIERLLRKDRRFMEQFCPNTKSIVLLKASKDNISYVPSADFPNTLDQCILDNGNRIAILLRNGEELHIIWTEERIIIKENFMISPKGERQLEVDDYGRFKSDDPDLIVSDDFTNKADLGWRQYFSRIFLLQILQGLTEYQKLIEFPVKVNFAFPSKYVIFSLADNSLVDKSFGTLSEYARFIGKRTKAGDHVLPTKRIIGSWTEKSLWGNRWEEQHRGRGYNNRARDCDIPDEVVRINLVDDVESHDVLYDRLDQIADELKKDTPNEERLKSLRKEHDEYIKGTALLEASGKDRVRDGDIEYGWRYSSAGRGYVWRETGLKQKRCQGYIDKWIHSQEDKKFYVSVDKPESWSSNRSGKIAVRTNLRMYSDEFINLEFLSAEMLRYYIETKQLGGYLDGNYAYNVTYLHKALEFIQKRESEEWEQFKKNVGNYPFSEDMEKYFGTLIAHWKLENDFGHWTNRLWKKFTNWYMCDIGDYENAWQKIRQNFPWVEKEN